MILKESITHYDKHQSSVFRKFLDASKACDGIHYCKLFQLLMKRELPAPIIRELEMLHTHNYMRFNWLKVISGYFVARNGVKQGAVLSPVIFCVYVDDL
jgi:hypothetical protein